MKRKMILAFILLLFILVVIMETQTRLSNAKESANPIPEDAIRLRILANSNSAADQSVKRQIRDAVNADVEGWVQHLKTAKQAKRVIRDHLDEVQDTVATKLAKMGLDESFTVKLGQADFPTKMYGGYVYPAGKYEALVITLGQGVGANWWCVLFPPLCFLDFSNGDAVKTDDETHKAEKQAEPKKVMDTGKQHKKVEDAGNQHQTDKVTQKVTDKNEEESDKPEVKFFLVDLFEGIGNFFSKLF
ncbi:stage II sporulation protein R [Pullulanibacillus pueri]|uniref:Stage II sporulation protein R n=1 Tax=Pullulanibacillus pueri TaxID=1437324 RepID=A0A8J3EMM1_9BACL|nr:stage II sporulation protein R [Pullulanibacillus pueri]MBM7681716.1 stage II sporulation protein R [Pullulanibacillus pueri]GGH84030.1 stage II sporulation protein R [Pullulanibacillus pueri]